MTAPPSFTTFFQAIHDQRPFAWQEAFAQACLEGSIPSTLAMPTGCGKTAVLDALVYAMACGPASGPERMARRVFFVVDRRLVVDSAYDRAARIANALKAAQPGSELHWFKQRLCDLTGDPDAPPLLAVRLRGGVPADDAWTRDPAQPTLITSTVDQVGSRLLFRGYGVHPRAAAIHAGLIGQDSLIVLDEVHLSPAFARTLEFTRSYAGSQWRTQADAAPVPALRTLQMSATPAADKHSSTFDFQAAELLDADETIRQRIRAPRPVLLHKVTGRSEDAELALRTGLLDAWRQLRSARPDAEASAILVNRVDRARAVFEAANRELDPDDDAVLVIGRIRPFDAEAVRARLLPRLKTDRSRETPRRAHLLVVATQTIEAGADLDFDLMVTEAAPADALRQRFGRLDRAGAAYAAEMAAMMKEARAASPASGLVAAEHGTTSPTSDPALAHRGEDDRLTSVAPASGYVARGAVVYYEPLHRDDPLYGTATKAAWADLEARATKPKGGRSPTVDFSLAAQRDWTLTAEVCTPQRHAPTLLPAHLDHAAQTSPPAHPPLDPAPFLHAPDAAPPAVRLVWRADLDEELLLQDPESAIDRVAALPPVAAEVLEIGIGAVRRWIKAGGYRGGTDGGDADVEGAPGGDDTDRPIPEGRRSAAAAVVRWRGVEDSEVVSLAEARPGDLLVLPATLGGADAFGWNPAHRDPVVDVAEWAEGRRGRRRSVRVHAAALGPWPDAPPPPSIASLAEHRAPETRVAEWLARIAADEDLPDLLRERAGRINQRPRLTWLDREGPHPHLIVEGPPDRTAADPPLDASSDGASLLDTGRAVALSVHSADVRDEAVRIARALGLPPSLSQDMALAAHLHDLGKADPRFQALLAGDGEDPLVEAGELLAKSARGAGQRAADRRARTRSGLPKGFRHEALSLDFAEAWLEAHPTAAYDQDLVLHLVASHHGHARPFFPVVSDPRPPPVRVDWEGTQMSAAHKDHAQVHDEVGSRFRSLQRRYGWHGLAHLEACLRLADHRASAREAQRTAP